MNEPKAHRTKHFNKLMNGQGDVIQKTIKAHGKLFRGLAKYHYKNIWIFSLASLFGLFFLFSGVLGIAICVIAFFKAIQQNIPLKTLIQPGLFFVLLAVFLSCAIAVKIFKRLIHVFKKEEKRGYKTKILFILTAPTVLAIFLLIELIRILYSIDFVF